MKRHIRLTDCTGLPVHHGEEWAAHILQNARTSLERSGLRFDNKTGTMRNDSGELESYVTASDFCPHPDVAAVMRWEFSRQINNAASRITRGHKAV